DLFHLQQQVTAGERLLEIGVLVVMTCGPDVSARAEDAGGWSQLARLFNQFTPTHGRHDQIRNHQINGKIGRESAERLMAAVGDKNTVTIGGKNSLTH